ncbi:MAG: class I SAM-dependent methyltransferase, partial [Candidatus Hodarchaeota archaeon]
ISITADCNVLDIGCGEGIISQYLFEKTKSNIFGLDFSHNCCVKASRLNPSCRFVEGLVEKLPFKESSFDFVIGNAILHHISGLKEVTKEIIKVCKQQGYIVFIEPNRYNLLMILLGIAKKHERKTLCFSTARLCNLLRQQLFEVRITPLNSYIYPYYTFPVGILKKIMECIEDIFEIPIICTHYMIIAKRENL